EKANYSTKMEQIVYLAAPGGEEIPGLIANDEIGQTTGGTSAAAAFTAGVAAKMLACYPTYYQGVAERIQTRLLLTARTNIDPDDTHKAEAGIVDPRLALIDPRRSWLKEWEKKIQPIKVQHWCQDTIVLRDEANEQLDDGVIQLTKTMRITSTGA